MESAGLSKEIKIDNPLERSIVADLGVAAMGGVVRGRIDVENLAIQLISDSARYAVQQSYANSSVSDEYRQSQRASRGEGHITQTTVDQQWESQLINDAEFTANTRLPSVTFDVNNSYVSQQLGQRVGEEVSRFQHVDPPRNPNGFWQRVEQRYESVFERRALIAEGRAAANSEVMRESVGHAAANEQNYLDLGYTESNAQTRAAEWTALTELPFLIPEVGVPVMTGAATTELPFMIPETGVAIKLGNGLLQVSKIANRWGFFGHNGAESSALRQTGAGNFTRSADEAYNAIRASKTDITKIAKNTGIKPQNIAKVKDHLFFNKHFLDKYVDFGIPAEFKVFDSDLEIANSWTRLESGNFTEADMQLLRHETAEAWYMRRNGPGYTAAHNAADARYPAPDLENMLENLNGLNP